MAEAERFYRVVVQLEEVRHESGDPHRREVCVHHRSVLAVGDDPDPLIEYLHEIKESE